MKVGAVVRDGLTALVAGHLFYSAARLTAGTRRTAAEVGRASTRAAGADGVPGCRFVVLLPMLREDRVVARTCHRLAEVVAADPHLEIVVVTGRSETHDRDAAHRALLAPADGDRERQLSLAVRAEAVDLVRAASDVGDTARVAELVAAHRRPTTAEVAEPLVAELNRTLGREAFHHVCVPDPAGTKVEKLNLAVARWSRAAAPGHGAARVYVGVYDADSYADPTTFALVRAEVTGRALAGRRAPEIFQQVSCYCLDLPSLTGTRGLFALADAIAQTRWALGFELPLYRTYSSAVRASGLRPLVYCVGHGCFVSLGFLDQIGGFPTHSRTDDLALGYVASALGAEVAPIPALDYCEVAPDPVQSMRQSRFWFSGSARFGHDLRHAREAFCPRLPAPQRGWLLLVGHARNLAWAGRGPAWVAAWVAALVGRRWRTAAVLGVAHVLYVQAGYLQTVRTLRTLPTAAQRTGVGDVPAGRLAAGCLAASATFVLRSLGPFSGALDLRRGAGRSWKQER